jgi:hypothetical protein
MHEEVADEDCKNALNRTHGMRHPHIRRIYGQASAAPAAPGARSGRQQQRNAEQGTCERSCNCST